MSDSRRLSRRQALQGMAGAGASIVVAACSSSSNNSSEARRTTKPTPRTPSSSPRAATAADWRALRRDVSGSILRPTSAGYDRARLLFDERFDAVRPAAVAQVTSHADVAHCLAFARRFGFPLRIRSGGHSYIGASVGPGLVIDLRRLNAVDANAGSGATIGAGAALGDVYTDLAAHGVSIPAGSCPSVGISGLSLGGGVGVVARRYGLTCDRLTEARVVTAEGNVITCNDSTHSDLFWALRGGGGSFGVVTSMTFATHPTGSLAHAYLAWPWTAAADVVASWQQWATAAPHALWSTAHVLATDDPGPPTVSVSAVMVGTGADLTEQIGRLAQSVPTAPTSRVATSESYEATMMLEAGCADLSQQECHVAAETPGGALPRDAFVAGSDFFRRRIPASGIQALVAAVAKRQSDPRLGRGGASFDVLGGAIDSVAADATAWSHRGALFNAQYTASWGPGLGNRPLARNQHSLATIHQSVHAYASGEAYQNYADDSLANPQHAYYGANLARLVDVRRTYDPTGVFTQPQGVPLT